MSDKTVLVVDDQTNVRNILEFNLKRRGFTVVSAQDGLSAISQATTQDPSLILLDIMMPGIDGFQVLEKLRSGDKTKGIPVLIVSAKGAESDILRALKLGAQDYVVKPFNLELLIQKVQKLMEQAVGSKAAAKPPAEAAPKQVARTWPLYQVVKLGAEFPADDTEFENDLVSLARNKPRAILIDLTETAVVETLSFGKLARAQQQVKQAGSVIKLISSSEEHKRTLMESGFIKHFELHSSWAEATKDPGVE